MKLRFYFLYIVTTVATQSTCQEIPALKMLENCANVTIPQELPGERYATLNKYGYIFCITSPIAQLFIDEAGPNKRFLELGAGFSHTTQQCLRKDIDAYTANDLSSEHLKIMCAQLKKEFGKQTEHYLKKLTFLPGRIPDVLPDYQNCYDSILLDKVFHFLDPHSAQTFLVWAQRALKPQGKLYIFNISPYCSGFDVLPIYKENKKKSGFFPGYIKNMTTHTNVAGPANPNYAIPDTTTFFMLEDLTALVESKKFTILKTLAARLPREQTPYWQESKEEDCDLVGIVAQKNEKFGHTSAL